MTDWLHLPFLSFFLFIFFCCCFGEGGGGGVRVEEKGEECTKKWDGAENMTVFSRIILQFCSLHKTLLG